MEQLRCKECNSVVDPGEEICKKCGYPLRKKEIITIKNNNNKWFIIFGVTIGSLLIIGIIIMAILKKIEYDNFKPEYYQCRGSNKYAEVNSISPKETNVTITKDHNDLSGLTGKLKEFMDDYCDNGSLFAKEKQVNYRLKCGDTQDTIEYIYTGKIDGAIKQLEDDEFECIQRIASNSPYLNELKKNYWCEYNKKGKTYYYYTFNDTIAEKYYQLTGKSYLDYTYYLNDDKLTFATKSYDYNYEYDASQKKYYEEDNSSHYLELCSKPETFEDVKTKYYIKSYGNNYSNRYYVSRYDNYKVTKIECTNGNSGTWNEELWDFIPEKNIDSTCEIYFDK